VVQHEQRFVNCIAPYGCFIRAPRRAIQAHDECEACISREIPTPIDDELLGARIEVALLKGEGSIAFDQAPILRSDAEADS